MELMIGIAVAAIIAALAAPSFSSFMNNNRVTAAQNNLVAALNLARSEAVRRATPVTVCASTNGTACATAADWPAGFIVFRDPGATGTVGSANDILQKWGATSGGVLFTTASANVQYQPTGLLVGGPAVTVDVSYTGCMGNHKRRVQVSLSGSISSRPQACP